MSIDYERMKRVYPKQKAALTRAKNIADPIKRRAAVIIACRAAVIEWDEIGAWPDGWATWQVALSDTAFPAHMAGDRTANQGLRLEDLANAVPA